MKAVDANLLELLKKSERFVVPIYQRVYSWRIQECEQLWQDILRAGSRTELSNHFTGSIVYIERDEGTSTAREPNLIIDGQQRITTVSLLLAALAAHLEEMPEAEREPVPGFSPQRIRGLYLTNPYEIGDDHFKLMLSKRDRDPMKAIIRNGPVPASDSRVVKNFEFFQRKLAQADVDLASVCSGINKLVIVDVKLTRGTDDPQLVFESMNATGRRLSQADLIRNFVMMDLQPSAQEQLYEGHWLPMEQLFSGPHEKRFDEFVRHYLAYKTKSIPRIDEIYEAFKNHSYERERMGDGRAGLAVDLSLHAEWFGNMALEQEPDPELASKFREMDLLASVAYPFQLRLYRDYSNKELSREELLKVLQGTISYVFRRAVCRIPTNSLNKTFLTLANAIDPKSYAESVEARLLTLPDYRRFPSDDEFRAALMSTDLYHFQRRNYLLTSLENLDRREAVSTSEYTIEHIMPQTLTDEWQEELGPEWESVHERLLHTLGNLTLTGYNPEYSNHPFARKRDIEGGFRESPLRLNRGLGQLDRWDVGEIEARAERLATKALKVWARPHKTDEVLDQYRQRFNDAQGFDWSQAHQILASIPEGTWTSYYLLAEAVETSAQAMASHLSRCQWCTNAHRVLTWDGRVAAMFRWLDEDDERDPLEMLEAEGVRIIDGHADPDQQLSAEDLLNLDDGAPVDAVT